MKYYLLHALSPGDFEELVFKICHEILGFGTISFSSGPDEGRDAYFSGTAQRFPSTKGPWTGKFVIQANHTARPWGPRGPTPHDRWHTRAPITPQQRAEFLQCVHDLKTTIRRQLELEDKQINHNQRAAVARAAIQRALETLNYLLVRRKRITPAFSS